MCHSIEDYLLYSSHSLIDNLYLKPYVEPNVGKLSDNQLNKNALRYVYQSSRALQRVLQLQLVWELGSVKVLAVGFELGLKEVSILVLKVGLAVASKLALVVA